MPRLTVNDRAVEIRLDPQTPLLWGLRDAANLTGTKYGCGVAQCGACTVHIDGVAVRSCAMPAAAVKATQKITTIEGLSPNGSHPIQKAWQALDVPQCGFCQSGMIMAATALLKDKPNPTDKDIDRFSDMVGSIKGEYPEVEICACLGLLQEGQAERLKEAGVDAYNHNINTAESHHDDIVSTHHYSDRVETIEKVKRAGVSACSGLIVGLGETDAQIVEALLALRDLGADSIPINFLVPFDGTPRAGQWELTPLRCLTIVALARLACPDTEIRLAGGREIHLRGLQGMALHAANSLFLGDYLTAEGQAAADDLALIADNGFTVEDHPLEPVGAGAAAVARARGAGTAVLPNA